MAITAPVDNDPVMGNLSAMARHVAAALQDSTTRMAVSRAMKDRSSEQLGLDLQSCESSATARAMFSAGERRGAGAATPLCQFAREQTGLVLYMDRDRLAAWDGSAIPVVTAIASPAARLPKTFRGYRSPGRTIDLPADGAFAGPVLVVLPYLHPTRAAAGERAPTTTAIRVRERPATEPTPSILVRQQP